MWGGGASRGGGGGASTGGGRGTGGKDRAERERDMRERIGRGGGTDEEGPTSALCIGFTLVM